MEKNGVVIGLDTMGGTSSLLAKIQFMVVTISLIVIGQFVKFALKI